MNLEKILAVSGKSGLYFLKVQTRTGFMAESLIDGKKITVNLKNNVSLLSEISIYTHEGEKPLSEIMQRIATKENKEQVSFNKENNTAIVTYFKEILPQYDEERVYPSDIKKILNWYNTLQVKGLITDSEPATSEEKIPDPKEIKETTTQKPKTTAKKN